jgi:hypothetical protein
MLQRFVDTAAVEAEIARVRSLSGDALRRRWQVLFGRSPPPQQLADFASVRRKGRMSRTPERSRRRVDHASDLRHS